MHGQALGKRAGVAAALAHQHRLALGQIHHGGGVEAAKAAVDDQLYMMVEQFADVVGSVRGNSSPGIISDEVMMGSPNSANSAWVMG